MKKFRWMDKKDFSKMTGIPIKTLNDWLSRKVHEIPYYRIGKLIKFKESEVAHWIDSRRVNSNSDDVRGA